MFVTVLTVVHIVVCIFLIVIVLLQHGKGADIGATFGGASNTVFGARGAATVLSKITVATAVLFMVTSMTLAVLATRQATESVFEEGSEQQAMPGMGATPEEGSEAAPAEPKAAGDDPIAPSAAPTETKAEEGGEASAPPAESTDEGGTGSAPEGSSEEGESKTSPSN